MCAPLGAGPPPSLVLVWPLLVTWQLREATALPPFGALSYPPADREREWAFSALLTLPHPPPLTFQTEALAFPLTYSVLSRYCAFVPPCPAGSSDFQNPRLEGTLLAQPICFLKPL